MEGLLWLLQWGAGRCHYNCWGQGTLGCHREAAGVSPGWFLKGYYSFWEWGTPGGMGLGALQPKVDWEEKWSLPKSHTTLTLILLEFAVRISPRESISQAQVADSSTGLELRWGYSRAGRVGLCSPPMLMQTGGECSPQGRWCLSAVQERNSAQGFWWLTSQHSSQSYIAQFVLTRL